MCGAICSVFAGFLLFYLVFFEKNAFLLDAFAPIEFGILKLTAFDFDEYLGSDALLNTFLQCFPFQPAYIYISYFLIV